MFTEDLRDTIKNCDSSSVHTFGTSTPGGLLRKSTKIRVFLFYDKGRGTGIWTERTKDHGNGTSPQVMFLMINS